jgi:haloalkane dehalogenase
VIGFESRDIAVDGTTMHYVQSGSGRPLVFLHGNPTSSFLWRDVLPALARSEHPDRLIALDLIGMGASGKPDIDYRLVDHIRYVESFLDELDLSEVVFVAHDWGVAICLDYLRRHPDRVRAVAVMEGHLRPIADWDSFDPGGRPIFQALRTPGVGERMALEENFLIETLLPAGMHRRLTTAELDAYRHPYPDVASRRPLLRWAREIPIAGDPADVAQLLIQALDHLRTSPVPKLLIHGRPGAVIDTATVSWCRQTLPRLTVADAGEASHFLPEDRPTEVVQALSAWLRTIPSSP